MSVNSNIEDIVISTHGVECAIDRLPTNSSPGPDGISTKLLKLTKPISGHLLGRLFQQSLSTGELPDDWKNARVVPTFKSEDKNVLNNYRPISLTCVSCKLLEHIISSQIMTYLSSNHLLFTNQHGFQRGRSCETQLFELVTDLHNSVHSSKPVDAIFIDFAKAFDRVPHKRLIHKLNKYNLSTSVVKWITNFLANRRQSVVIGQCLSSSLPVTSGVPQGSVLGPVLFLIYVNDLHTNITSCTRLFADDCVIYRPITGPLDCKILQDDLHKISDWCDTWLMQINTSKTKAITFTTQRHPSSHTYLIRNDPIENVSSFKYLGVHLSSDLSWNTHIQHVTNKAMKTLGFLKRTLFQANPETKLVAYSTLVRSQLEYASIIWHPHQSYLGEKIESLQNKAARFIVRDYSRFTSVTGIKHRLNLPPLHTRRKVARLSFIHKLYHSSSAFKDVFSRPAHHISPRLDHPFKINPIYARTNMFKNSPLLLAISDWNSLPREIASIGDHESFVAAVNTMLLEYAKLN
ncbi:Reverse transcriptase (RNA-dependent DNA polymerase) [Anaplasma phagocytophilum]|nr:Reverse transcriptase (RNA-dependent DNA polymerase) [Anaplasma phagocytophilum]